MYAGVVATRNVNLTGMLDDYVEDRVRSGAFQNASEVVRDALRLHKARTDQEARKLEQLDRLIQEGDDDIAAGRYVELEWNEVDSWLDRLGRSARS